jgi:hypothetical protein
MINIELTIQCMHTGDRALPWVIVAAARSTPTPNSMPPPATAAAPQRRIAPLLRCTPSMSIMVRGCACHADTAHLFILPWADLKIVPATLAGQYRARLAARAHPGEMQQRVVWVCVSNR